MDIKTGKYEVKENRVSLTMKEVKGLLLWREIQEIEKKREGLTRNSY